MDNSVILILITGTIALFYYQKYKDLQLDYARLQSKMSGMKAQLRELEMYKNDVSKTFQILDNELNTINEHIKRQQPPTQERLASDILTTLINNSNNQSIVREEEQAHEQLFQEPEPVIDNEYDRYKL